MKKTAYILIGMAIALALFGTYLEAKAAPTAASVDVGGTGLRALKAGFIPFGAGTSPFATSSALFWASSANRLSFTYGSTTALSATTFFGALVGNSSTATALAANGTNCSAGNYPLGVDASGNVESCTAATTGTVTAVSVASANGFAGSSGGGATPALTLTTTITGMLKGNGTAISAASNGTDFTLITANTCGAGQFFNGATAAGIFSCGTPSGGGGTGLATTSPVAGGNLLYYNASGAGSATGVATSSIGAGTGLTFSGTPGAQVGGSNGTYSISPSGDISWNSHKITSLLDPTSAQDAATKLYVDNAVAGTDFKDAAKYSTTAALPTVVYSNGSSGVGATLTGAGVGALSLDSNTPSVGDRVLVKNQVDQTQNGVYTVTAVGSGAAVFVMTRATDFDQSADIKAGDALYVISGTVNGGSTWVQTTQAPITMGSSNIVFSQIAGPGSLTAGTGIGISGLTITNNGVISNSCPGGFLSCSGTNPSAFTLGTLGITNGGTGQTSASAAFNALSPLTNNGDILVRVLGTNVGLPIGTNGFVLGVSGGVPTWLATTTLSTISGLLNLTNQVTGVLPIANGGTGASSLTTGALDYFDGSKIASIASSFFNSAANWLGFGTTTPHWLMQLASSTAPQLALTSASSAGNFHWTFNNIFGNLFLATSSASTFATSTTGANTGYIEFPNNGGCIGCSDITLTGGINLRNALYVSATSSGYTANTFQDVYTAPAGRRAIVMGYTLIQTTGGTFTTRGYAKISGVYYPLTASSTATNNTNNPIVANGFILEPGESFSILPSGTAATGAATWINILEYDASVPVKSVRLFNPTAATTTLYTVPTGVSANILGSTPLASNASQLFGYVGGAGDPEITPFIVKSGGTAAQGVNTAFVTTFPSVKFSQTLTHNAVNALPLEGANTTTFSLNLNSGDSIQMYPSLNLSGTNSLFWVNVSEH